jgi:hypothetical protein
MIKYFVRTTGERELDGSFSQIEYILLVDKDHRPVESFIEQLEIISKYDAVLLEDDVQLCKGFDKKIESIIKQYPDRVINFFTRPWEYFKTKESINFSWNQCTYYPKGLAKEIASTMMVIYKDMIENKDKLDKKYLTSTGYIQYGRLESKALEKLGLKHIQFRPCLVQHLDYESLIGNDDGTDRTTLYFVDYLDNLKINYENISTYDLKRLERERKYKFLRKDRL